nr:MAG TPA: hypothetical protein [Caudoviricetes sp.]DAT91357.1 MAG TPA: hypothetical protein [Caudoviricetes sp.]
MSSVYINNPHLPHTIFTSSYWRKHIFFLCSLLTTLIRACYTVSIMRNR